MVAVYVEVSSVVGTATAGLTGSLALAVPCCLNTRTPAVTSARTTTTAVAEPIRMAGRRGLFGFGDGIGIGYAGAGPPSGRRSPVDAVALTERWPRDLGSPGLKPRGRLVWRRPMGRV